MLDVECQEACRGLRQSTILATVFGPLSHAQPSIGIQHDVTPRSTAGELAPA